MLANCKKKYRGSYDMKNAIWIEWTVWLMVTMVFSTTFKLINGMQFMSCTMLILFYVLNNFQLEFIFLIAMTFCQRIFLYFRRRKMNRNRQNYETKNFDNCHICMKSPHDDALWCEQYGKYERILCAM